MNKEDTEHIKVSSTSNPNTVAGSISIAFDSEHGVMVSAIGAGAVNQAVKSIAVARGYCAAQGKDLIARPMFDKITINDEEKTVIKFSLERIPLKL